eukprot:TRINITY_DN28328_c0_g1_i1.p1 TRINITY_DN28328_c0_g1~~TRINITY_DN28328_c0_g1_i1.p1  ORF type:complete len:234 (+),score=55.77 TRINITY_DN28328_c0_g1_i1:49-750(+)
MSYASQATTTARSTDGRTEAELLQSTVRSLAEATDTSDRVLTTLNGQTEQLHKIKEDSDAIDHNLEQTQKLLNFLKPMGWVKGLFGGRRSSASASGGGYPASGSGRGSGGYAGASSAASSSGGGYAGAAVGTTTGRGAARLLAAENARKGVDQNSGPAGRGAGRGQSLCKQDPGIERAYDQIDSLLDGLKERGHVINQTLDHHNKMLPDLASSADRQQEKIKKQTAEMARLRK